jgi:hypothetical protein
MSPSCTPILVGEPMYIFARTSHISVVLRFTVVSVSLIVITMMRNVKNYLCPELYCKEQRVIAAPHNLTHPSPATHSIPVSSNSRLLPVTYRHLPMPTSFPSLSSLSATPLFSRQSPPLPYRRFCISFSATASVVLHYRQFAQHPHRHYFSHLPLHHSGPQSA